MKINLRIKELIAVKERKEKRRLTYKIIAAETGLAESTIAGYMTNTVNRFDRPILETWCNYLDAQPGDLFANEPDNEGKNEPALVGAAGWV